MFYIQLPFSSKRDWFLFPAHPVCSSIPASWFLLWDSFFPLCLAWRSSLEERLRIIFFEEFHWISAFWLPDLACCADAHEYDALPLTHTHYTLSLFHWTHTSRVAQAFNQYALLKLRFKLWPIFQSFSHEIWQRCKARVLNHPCGHAKHGLYEKSMWCLSLWIRLLFSWIPWFVDRKCWRFFWNWSFVMVVVVVTLIVLVCLCSLWAIPW